MFEEYLINKKIDAKAFRTAEPQLYESWEEEFSQMHPNSFTAQKLYLINPIRLKYTLLQKQQNLKVSTTEMPVADASISETSNQKPHSVEDKSDVTETKPTQISRPPKPLFKPKPKIN